MDKIIKQANIFKSLSDPTRLRILKILQLRPLCVCEIQDVLGLTASTISEHLSVLRENGLVISEKKGKIVCNRLNFYAETESVPAVISMLSCLMTEDMTIKSDIVKAKKTDCRVILARKS